ncbi:MAG: hypothetical protein ACXV7F_14520 [Methylomonas sp.]
MFTWLPLLLFSLLPEEQVSPDIKVPFLYDIDVHARFLVALPLMIVAELVVHQRLKPLILQFVERGIVSAEVLPHFEALVDSSLRLRNSVMIEVGLIILVFLTGHYIWSIQTAMATANWYSISGGMHHRFSLAGYWYTYVSIPIFQFIYIRWYFRIFIWARFLWQLSRLELGDIQSLADLANSFEVVKGMRLFPFDKAVVLQAAVVTLLPVLPLVLTMISQEELVKRLLGILL